MQYLHCEQGPMRRDIGAIQPRHVKIYLWRFRTARIPNAIDALGTAE